MAHRFPLCPVAALVGLLALAGCGTAPPPKPAAVPPAAAPAIERFSVALDDGFLLEYQVERKISTINQRSCYAFLSGVLHNRSARTLSRKAILDFNVFHAGRQLFRDITNPLADIPPGGNARFGVVTSPLHRDGCVAYDEIRVSLRPPAS